MIVCSFCGQAHKGDEPVGRCVKCYADLSDEPDSELTENTDRSETGER